MRILQISTVCGSGSVGRILVDIYHTIEKNGDEGIIAYGRQTAPEGLNAWRFGSNADMSFHVLSTFFKGEHGFASAGQTRRLIKKIRELRPDVIHLHNIHGFVLQVELLFAYLKEAKVPVVWTLHDCWPYTGHCAFYDYHGCEKWKTACESCPEHKRTYPYALFRDNTANNYRRKKAAFTGVEKLTIVTPSKWLAEEVGHSFLREYPVRVIPNGIDLGVFCPEESGLRKDLGLEGKCVVLGVANVWERRKGLDYFLWLAEKLPDEYRIVLIGLSDKQKKTLPAKAIGMGRTSSARELAEYYSMADMFVNATLEDNFPTTNLEALACGTPVITFETGGSPESLGEPTGAADKEIRTTLCGRIVPKGDKSALLHAILEERKHPRDGKDCVMRAQSYEKYAQFRKYVELYHELGTES